VASVSSPGPTASAGGTYRVRAGDTLGRIAKRHGVSESALATHNEIRDVSLVKIGQTLRIPGSNGAGKASGGVYQVQRGDTLDSIARRHGTTAKSLAALNGLRNRHRIKAGQRLVLPGS
jgi:LysM repeat protein